MNKLREALQDLKASAGAVASAVGVEVQESASGALKAAVDRLTPEFVENAIREQVKTEVARLLPGMVSEAVHRYFAPPTDDAKADHN